MRTWGRVNGVWTIIETDKNGFNDYVYATALIQELLLNLGESPFWGNRGIPAHPSVVQQIAPDYYTMLMQQRYAQFFLSLIITKLPNAVDSEGRLVPTYRVNITTMTGVQLQLEIPT